MGEYQNFVMFIVKDDVKDGFLIDGSPVPSDTAYTAVPGTDYVGGFVEVSFERHEHFVCQKITSVQYRKNSKNWDTLNYYCDCPTNGIVGFYSAILRSKDADRITNRVDTD